MELHDQIQELSKGLEKTQAKKDKADFLKILKESLRQSVFYIFMFSAIINILSLVLPLYSLQVFDRVLSSGSIPTLTALTTITLFCFVLYSIFNLVREFILVKIGIWLDEKLNDKVFKLSVNHSSISGQRMNNQFVAEAMAVKNFVTSQSIFSLFDLPWSLLFFFVIFMISPWICLLVVSGAIILFILTYYKEFKTKPRTKETNDIASSNTKRGDEFIRNAEVIEAMGMFGSVYKLWKDEHDIVVERTRDTAYLSSKLGSISKCLRMVLQIAIIGVGTYLALQKEMTFGGIIACSIIAGKALGPIDSIMAVWGSFGNFRDSYNKLSRFLGASFERPESTNVGSPEGRITLEKVVFMKPGTLTPIIKGVEMEIMPGETVGVIGPSGGGKSTLIKLMAGIYKPTMGVVKLDGGDIFRRNRDDVGKYIGYLPQSIDLLKGTVKENISRFDHNASDDAVIEAAKETGVHELIMGLPSGYDTIIGEGKVELSGGQKQRVGLARAFYGKPKLIFLDEPNANLDEVGEFTLLQAILHAKKEGISLVMISHKPSIINIVDKIVVIRDGVVMDFGPKADIMAKYASPGPGARNQAAVKKAVETKQEQEKAEKEIGTIVEKIDGDVSN